MFLNYFSKILILLALPAILGAQDWGWVQLFGNEDNETIEAVLSKDSETHYIAGTFKEDFPIGSAVLNSVGNNDVYLAKLGNSGEVEWVLFGGSSQNDGIKDMAMDEEGNLYLLGFFWFDFTFGDINLSSELSSKSFFILKITSDGSIAFAKKIEGDQEKDIHQIMVDDNGAIYVTGNFNGNLEVDGDLTTATDTSSMVLAKISTTGNVAWVKEYPSSLFIDAVGIDVYEDKILVSGHFRGVATFDQETVSSPSFHDDLFTVLLDENGNTIWARRAGGVYQKVNSACGFDGDGNIYTTGYFLGVIKMDETIEIQTNGLNYNIFLLKYNLEGQPIWAQSIGGALDEYAVDILCQEDRLFLCGHFQGQMNVDGITLSADPVLSDGFVLKLDLNGIVQKGYSFQSDGYSFAKGIVDNDAGEIYTFGTFEENITIGEQVTESQGGFDGFMAQLGENFTPVGAVAMESAYQLSPNPCLDKIWIECASSNFTIDLFNANGVLLGRYHNPSAIDLTGLSSGMYWTRLREEKKGLMRHQTFFKIR